MQHQLIFRSTVDHVFNGSGKFAKLCFWGFYGSFSRQAWLINQWSLVTELVLQFLPAAQRWETGRIKVLSF